jgi:hypothetical protein
MTEAEGIPPEQHISDDDPRYDGFRIREYWMLTTTGPDNQEAPLWVTEPQAVRFHLSPGPSMASDARRLHHLRQYAQWMADGNPGMTFVIRHFVPEGDDETFASA